MVCQVGSECLTSDGLFVDFRHGPAGRLRSLDELGLHVRCLLQSHTHLPTVYHVFFCKGSLSSLCWAESRSEEEICDDSSILLTECSGDPDRDLCRIR